MNTLYWISRGVGAVWWFVCSIYTIRGAVFKFHSGKKGLRYIFFGSVYSTKANISHTHNNHSSKIQIPCEYGNIYKYQKNGWAIVWWVNINLTNIPTDQWFTLVDVGWENQVDAGSFYGNFSTSDPTIPRFAITTAGLLRVYMFSTCEYTTGHYGYIVYPTTD